MGFLDFLLGRPERSPQDGPRRPASPRAAARTDDEIAVERYQYLLRTAPPETIEQVHTEAFSKLTPEQRDILFRQLTESVDPSERPADAAPATLALAATRAELREPGTLTKSFGNQGQPGQQAGGMGMGGMFGSSMLGTVAGFVIGSALVSAFLPMDGGGADGSTEASGEESGGDAGGDAGADSGGDFGGGDFGGGDFGGDFGF